jgi:hypothetical protein
MRGPIMQWLKRDALNRAWRTFLHTSIGGAALAGAGDAALQAVAHELSSSPTGAAVDWRRVALVASSGAITGAIASALAYLHRTVLDPSRIPSALPPEPPPTDQRERT